ncbi:pyridoxal-phosphate dependent enzyme [Streptomyces sp. NBC_00370]|uniref:pyridoxal-phosphate dependent enzyme n=1 Tax=Streptomyces sp. NBC_00370 TaxID=2975728 RepID=UPI0032449E62
MARLNPSPAGSLHPPASLTITIGGSSTCHWPAETSRSTTPRSWAAVTDHPEIETLVVPVGGGGLAAGTATIAKHLHPGIKVIGVEPQEGADTLLSLRCGQRIALPEAPATIGDGFGHSSLSPLTWAVSFRLLDAVVIVADRRVTTAMAFAFRHLKVVAESSGVCALPRSLAASCPTNRG